MSDEVRILVVEDEPSMQIGLADNLGFEGYSVDVASDGNQALQKILDENWDLILLDVMMPGMSGFDVLKSIRKQGVKVAVIMLSARSQEMDRVLGLELGADDYIIKPFSLRELLARIKAVLRRSESESAGDNRSNIQIGRLRVDFQTGRAWQDNEEIELSNRELDLIRFLWQHKGETISREKILQTVWGFDEAPTSRTVDNFIVKLRQKIESTNSSPRFIISVHGVGYKLVSSSDNS